MIGIDGLIALLLKHLLESMLAGELNHQLTENKLSGIANQ